MKLDELIELLCELRARIPGAGDAPVTGRVSDDVEIAYAHGEVWLLTESDDDDDDDDMDDGYEGIAPEIEK